jgi:capsule polysaccharide export protein KpsE/RkpR
MRSANVPKPFPDSLTKPEASSAAPAALTDAAPAAPAHEPPSGFAGTFLTVWNGVSDWLGSRMSFWTVVPGIGLVGFIYLFLLADSFYQSEAIVSLQNSSSISSSLTSLVGSSLLGGSSTNESGAVLAYIESHEMLQILDKKFHLRQNYSAPTHNPFWRLSSDASTADFLQFYQGMVTVNQDATTGLITIDVLDYDPQRARDINQTILSAAQVFVNNMSSSMRAATIKYAQEQLTSATKAVEIAQPYERSVAEAELTAAQQAMAAAQGLASQQQAFLVPVSNATAPTDTSVPDKLVDEASVLLAAAVLYMIAHLLLSNVRDHRNA